MGELHSKNFLKTIISKAPILLLYISVLNEFDFNYLGSNYFSFNFTYILLFYWSLKKNESFNYVLIFIAGLINDVVVGIPLGISSLLYLLICGFAVYLRNITLRPSLVKDWIYFLVTVLVVNSLLYTMLTLIFSFEINYTDILINTFFTFLLYFVFYFIFKVYEKIAFESSNA